MAIELIPSELGSFLTVPDINGNAFDILVADPNPVTINHRLGDRLPSGMLVVDPEGDVRVWMTSKTKTTVAINRSSSLKVRIYLF